MKSATMIAMVAAAATMSFMPLPLLASTGVSVTTTEVLTSVFSGLAAGTATAALAGAGGSALADFSFFASLAFLSFFSFLSFLPDLSILSALAVLSVVLSAGLSAMTGAFSSTTGA